ncbi:MAG: N-acetylmuramoyl-L-alanine amidase [Planctomycetes bacterium]|nr:N-acetylmuramoyl-L-alanine amidase [Planctomycetota bacterium]
MSIRRSSVVALALALAALPASLGAQALAGRRIVVSPGHGYYWHSSLGWTTQRGVIDGLIEDVHTNEIMFDHVLPYLEGAGANVISCRARTRTLEERLVDNDQGAPAYTETGAWFTSASSGWNGGSYRYANTSPSTTATASFRATMTRSDRYPVYVHFRSGANRSTSARLEIDHAGGSAVRLVDQTRDGSRWVFVGEFDFRAGFPAVVRFTNQSSSGSVVIADAVKIGDGVGSIVRGALPSGRARWLESSRYHAQYFGAPSTVWDSVSGGQDNDDDVTCRPRYAEWWGADLYFSLHTNAGGGSGTSSYIHDTAPTAGSVSFQNALQARVVQDLRQLWDPAWIDRGRLSANFGELRLLSTMPGCLLELAFHDDLGGDIEAIHHPEFRRIAGRAIYRAIHTYLAPGTPWVLDPPTALACRNDGAGGLRVLWSPVSGALGYRVRVSTDGFAWSEPLAVSGTSFDLPALGHGSVRYARVAAVNAGGFGPESTPVGGCVAASGIAPLLLVDGFDRRDRYVKELENPRAWLPSHGGAASAIASAGFAFDGATNEAVSSLLVSLPPYRCVAWILGEESTADETFSATEQALVAFYLNGGGRLFFTGAEVGWDLDSQGSASDRAFYENVLGQNYLLDDAGVYQTTPRASGPLAPLPALRFDDGSAGIYDVDYPDVVGPAPGSNGQIVLTYANGLGAAVLRSDGRVLGLGFPLEALVDASLRVQLAERALQLLCPLGLDPLTPFVPGQTMTLRVDLPSSAGDLYLCAASLGSLPGIPLGDGRAIPLNYDPLFELSLLPGSPVFPQAFGTLDAFGRATLAVNPPADPLLQGFAFHLAAFAIDPPTGVISGISSWRRFVF